MIDPVIWDKLNHQLKQELVLVVGVLEVSKVSTTSAY